MTLRRSQIISDAVAVRRQFDHGVRSVTVGIVSRLDLISPTETKPTTLMMTKLRLGAGHNINNQTPRAVIRDMVCSTGTKQKWPYHKICRDIGHKQRSANVNTQDIIMAMYVSLHVSRQYVIRPNWNFLFELYEVS